MGVRVRFIFYALLFMWSMSRAQDTSFVNKHMFSTPVRNVLVVENAVYVKTGDGLYRLEGARWEKQKIRFEKAYVFYDKSFVEGDYLPPRYGFDVKRMSHLIPQISLTSPSKAEIGDRLFVSVGGSLFEYAINNQYKHEFADRSIREIYLDSSIKVISTYSGIYINDSLRAQEPVYANGYFRKIKGKYYLSSDHLFEFVPPSSFREIPSGINLFAGYSRKLIEFQQDIYAMNTKSINRFSELKELQPIHQGFEYLDIEQHGDRLLFCTQSGEVFAYDGKTVMRLVKLNSRIRDIYVFKQSVYLSSDAGVFHFNGLDSSSLQQLAQTPFAVMTLIDPQRNIWISTENGLYILPDKKKDPILFIKDVEFNRGALTLFKDDIYAGSISGLYIFNSYDIVKNFLPLYFNAKNANEASRKRNLVVIGASLAVLALGFSLGFFLYKRRKAKLLLPIKEVERTLTLAQIREDIRNQGILTVEGLADYYKTNTVQLNRQFKTFATTPGKFMKQVKLDLAAELLSENVPMDEVAAKVGYSASFIRKELGTNSGSVI